MLRTAVILLLFSCLFASFFSFASTDFLAQQRTWLKLLHFDQKPAFGQSSSAVIDDRFF